jgi:hypothetical protein
METLLDARRGWAYYVLLFLSGFIWEKHLLLPFSVALDDIYARRRLTRTLIILIFSVVLGAVGQVFLRLIITSGDTAGWGTTLLAANLKHIPHYLVGTAVLYGAQIYFMVSDRKTVPFIFRALALQIPVWFVIYLALNGVLAEMRVLYIMVPYTWPVLAMFFDKISGQNTQGIA